MAHKKSKVWKDASSGRNLITHLMRFALHAE